MIALYAIVAQASVAAFAPPLDRPLLVTTAVVRTDNGVTRRFETIRRIVFSRTAEGFRAAVTTQPQPARDGDDDPTAMFADGMAQLAGRTLTIELDASGAVTGIVDLPVAWRTVIEGVAALAPTGQDALSRVRAARIAATVKLLEALPATRQRATLGSVMTQIIAGEVEPAPATRAVTVPGRSAYGTTQLDGFRAVRRSGGGIEIDVSAQGQVALNGPDGPAQGRMSLESVRSIDPQTGLIVGSREHVRTLRGDGSVAAERLTTTRIDPQGITIPVD